MSLAAAALISACDGGGGSPSSSCTPGQQIACDCLAASKGVQICAADGKRLEACQCSSGRSGGSNSGGGSGGSTVVGGASSAGGAGPSGGIAAGLGGASTGGVSGGGAAGMAGGPGVCKPVGQQGCLPGERCTWIGVDAGLRVGCAPNGTVALGETCVRAVGADGTDNCQAGLRCDGLTCRKICDTSTEASCSANYLCSANSDTPSPDSGSSLGVCMDTCNPVTQVRNTDLAPACGSANPGTPTRGCYGHPDGGFVCASAGNAANVAGRTVASAYLNSCAPGFEPFLRSSSDPKSDLVCAAFCSPAPTSINAQANAGGLVGSGHTCADRGAPGAECRYLFLVQNTVDPQSPTSLGNTLGFCFTPSNYQYDTNNDQIPDTLWPSCTTLATTDIQTPLDGLPDNVSWGCAPNTPPP